MELCRRPVMIDKCRLCFKAEPQLLDDLETIKIGGTISYKGMSLTRIYEDDAYFNVYCIHEDGKAYFGKFKFNLKIGGVHGNMFEDGTRKSWVAIDNKVLYDRQRLRFIYNVAENLNLTLNNFTMLELCRDMGFNVPALIKRYLHDSSITTILNRTVIHDRIEDRPEITYDYNGSLSRQLKYLTVYVKQREAIANKNKGVFLKAYNKKHEIETCSDKKYIMNYYHNPKSLYRLEVSINSEESSQYLKGCASLDVLFDQQSLEDMYYHFIKRILRFRIGAKRVLDWKSILDNTIDKYRPQGTLLRCKTQHINNFQ